MVSSLEAHKCWQCAGVVGGTIWRIAPHTAQPYWEIVDPPLPLPVLNVLGPACMAFFSLTLKSAEEDEKRMFILVLFLAGMSLAVLNFMAWVFPS